MKVKRTELHVDPGHMTCPHCQHGLNSHGDSGVAGEYRHPIENDLTVCHYCLGVAAYVTVDGGGLDLRLPTEEEVAETAETVAQVRAAKEQAGTDPIKVLMAMPEHFGALPERERGQR